MFDSTIWATLVIVFRETLEAGLIVGIILTVLARLGALRFARYVWLSTVLAVAASFLVGWVLGLVTQTARGTWEKAIEGIISLGACGVLTYMVFWMHQQARRVRAAIEIKVETAVTHQELSVMILLPFLAVLREGAETVLFLKAVSIQNSGPISAIGGLLGAELAVFITAIIFVGGRRVPLKPLFQVTGWLLLFIAAGLLAYGIHELEELGWINPLVSPVWNINPILNEKQGLGSFLKALFGYNGNPSLTEVLAYGLYLFGIRFALRRVGRTSPPPNDPNQPKSPIPLSRDVSASSYQEVASS
ncbi:MAG: FTR1 family protein [Candidatus Omnitrophica bacterium]|nr:FTR1 family protein [Candidatus Omnitrophota bacterium]